jgi:hypothetical protein
MPMTRTQLLELTLEQLKILGDLYGVKSKGNARYIINWVDALVEVCDSIDISGYDIGGGLQFPSGQTIIELQIFDKLLGKPTPFQAALINAAKQGSLSSNDLVKYQQEQIVRVYEAQSLVQRALILLEQG